MRTQFIIWSLSMLLALSAHAQQTHQNAQSIYKIPQELLAGEGLDSIPQQDTTRTVFQKLIYSGEDLAIFMVAIGTGITNEFKGFPLEEFIFWANGKAVVEPDGEKPFAVNTGDYFVQAKGFNGKWNFVDIGGVHLELALIAKHRPDSTVKSPIPYAQVLDRDMLSGVSVPNNRQVYKGVEITVNLINEPSQLTTIKQERMLHVLNGVLTVMGPDMVEHKYYPGDFLVVQAGYQARWTSKSLQQLRMLEVYKTK